MFSIGRVAFKIFLFLCLEHFDTFYDTSCIAHTMLFCACGSWTVFHNGSNKNARLFLLWTFFYTVKHRIFRIHLSLDLSNIRIKLAEPINKLAFPSPDLLHSLAHSLAHSYSHSHSIKCNNIHEAIMAIINFVYTLDIFQLTHFEKWFLTKDANTHTQWRRVCALIGVPKM